MPSAIKTAREYGDDLAVIFVECQGSTPDQVERFAWERGWMGTSAMWTSERPFATGARGLPNCALLGADGRLILKGHPGSLHGKIIDAIEEEIDAGKKPPEGAPRSLRSAYKALAKGDYARAHEEAMDVARDGDGDAAAAEAFAKDVEARIEKDFARVAYLLDKGHPLRAEELLGELEDGVDGLEGYEARVDELKTTFDSDEVDAELKADKAFSRLEEKLFEDGLEEKLLKKVARLVEKHDGTRVAERARALLKVAGFEG